MSTNHQNQDFYIGPPVSPEDLMFREDFIRELFEALQRQHLILSAPRRTGKTSVLDYMVKYPAEGFLPISVFVQDMDHPADFIFQILDRFNEKHPNILKKIFSGGKLLMNNVLERLEGVEFMSFKLILRQQDPNWRDRWREYGDEFFKQIRATRQTEPRLLFLVDEFPDMLLNMKKAHPDLVLPFLSWLREHRTATNPKVDRMRWLMCGSVNLSSTLETLQALDKINDFEDIPLPILTATQVETFVAKMLTAREVAFEATLPQQVAQQLGRPVPLFMQMVTQNLYRIWSRQGEAKAPLNSEDVRGAFAELIVSSGARDKLQHFHSRINVYYEKTNQVAAYSLLAELSLSEKGLSRAWLFSQFEKVLLAQNAQTTKEERKQRFNRLMRDLENDFYIVEVGESFDFASGVMKSWWRKYYA